MRHVEDLLNDRIPVMRYLDDKQGWKGNYYLQLASSLGYALDGVVKKGDGSNDIGVWVASNPQSALNELRDVRLKLHTVNENSHERFTKLIFVVIGSDGQTQRQIRNAIANDTVLTIELLFIQDTDLAKFKYVRGADVFQLYDTYGFPTDMTADAARERGFALDLSGFEQAMGAQRERARAASQFESKASISADLVQRLKPTQFLGYGALDADALKVIGIVRDGREVQELRDGEQAMLILDATPFYAESGGQVGDTGELSNAGGRFIVIDTVKLAGSFHGHVGTWHGKPLRLGAPLAGSVDASRRQSIVLNHSATHLLHAALRRVLGEHVAQKGSLVAPDRLRFDFSHFKPVSHEELRTIEDIVNTEVRRNVEAEVHDMAYDEAIDFGAMALFGEKYGDRVRVLRMGDFSTELCGGTHVARTGDIGLFKIVSESGVASGIRRIEALTGAGALAFVADEEKRLGEIAHLLSAGGGDAIEKLRQVLDRQKKLERELEAIKARAASVAAGDLAASAQDVKGIKVIAARLDGADAKALRDSVDAFKQKLGDCVVLLAGGADGKIALVAGVHGRALERIKAGELVAHVASQINGKGGGRADMAQGGGEDTPKLATALAEVPAWVGARLA
ncbi:MAG: alanine--tRNA ligase [Xanthomonadaceae bacterium]|nr:alanine--tRNA ligase [Xanthomonadaceae bacterium]MDE2256373.1 alanine--tRNA ligase [Xanthomonadaceae bacterium]